MEGLTATISLTFDPTRPGEGVTPVVLSPDPPPGDPMDDPDQDPAPPPPDPGTQKRVRDRTAERRAAKEKADAEAKAQGNGAQADDPLMGATAGPGTGDPFGDDADPPGPAPKPAVEERVRTPKECMDGSIVLLRQCFASPGGADAVKALQKTYKVSKFIDLPLDVAPGLWKESLALAQKLQIKIPPGL
jgi:hypothetical protein